MKLTLFFQLFWKEKFASRPRDLHELYLLVRCSDLLQQGRISEVADALAGRIMALEVAASSGSWSTAKFLEVETLDSGNLARPETLLAAQKHARLVAKSEQGWTSWSGKGKGYDGQESWATPWKGTEKTKGKKGKSWWKAPEKEKETEKEKEKADTKGKK